jgi:hypothetical protein
MKKIIASAVGLMLVGGVAATSAVAVESQFGGYWRTRAFMQDNFTQPDSSYNRTDNRTRLYYTAKFSDKLKFVNKFEFNSSWGDDNGGRIKADATNIFKIKNSYADFTIGNVNTKLGIQGGKISRGFIFSDDFSGATITAKLGDVKVPFMYISDTQGDAAKTPDPHTDTHIFAVMPTFKVSDAVKITPHMTWATETKTDNNVYWLGVDADLKMDGISAWGTFIYNGGEISNVDVSAFLVAAGAKAGIVHGQAFYATGQDNGTDISAFLSCPGQSYYWSEIMGFGIFDNAVSANAPADKISDIAAFNAGVTVKPADKLKLDFDVWYAMLAEDNAAGDNDLGLELDGKLTYALMDNLNAEFVLAYLVAGDATGDENVMEGGVRISLKF